MTNNIYVAQLIEQTGMTEREAHQSNPARKRSFPCTIHGRYFASEAQYEYELAEFLNGN
jgi:hypothetical protein